MKDKNLAGCASAACRSLTGGGGYGLIEEALAAGAVGCFSKPIEFGLLEEIQPLRRVKSRRAAAARTTENDKRDFPGQ
jgi:hypothetical protein